MPIFREIIYLLLRSHYHGKKLDSKENVSQPPKMVQKMMCWLVDSTLLKNISQIGSFPQVGMKIKNIWPPPSLCCLFCFFLLWLFSTNGWLLVWVDVWDLRVPLSNNPFPREIPGIQTTGPQTNTLPCADFSVKKLQSPEHWRRNVPLH